MSLKELLEIARAAVEAKVGATTKKMAHEIVRLLDAVPVPTAWAPEARTSSHRMGCVHVPRGANRDYSPSEARQLAVALLHAADIVEARLFQDEAPEYDAARPV